MIFSSWRLWGISKNSENAKTVRPPSTELGAMDGRLQRKTQDAKKREPYFPLFQVFFAPFRTWRLGVFFRSLPEPIIRGTL